ncbi:molybdopterin-dependent oxidoreductase, partial [Saccharothrix sp. MB29]|nr:molybdopterin-dependent oxidoreductase [Saccharothrix sp. MB29]
RCCVGFDRFASYLLGELDGIAKDAAWAARITGIGRDAITDLARRLTTHRSLIMVNYAVQRADHGEQPIWMSVVLAAMAGSMGRPGCGWWRPGGRWTRRALPEAAPSWRRYPRFPTRFRTSSPSPGSPMPCCVRARSSTTTADASPA